MVYAFYIDFNGWSLFYGREYMFTAPDSASTIYPLEMVFSSYSNDNPLEAIWGRDAEDDHVYYDRQCLKLNFTDRAKTVLAASLGNGDGMVRRFEFFKPSAQPQSDIRKISAAILNLVDVLVFSGENFSYVNLTISQVAPVKIIGKGNTSSFGIKPTSGTIPTNSGAVQATAPRPGICIATDCSFLYFYDSSIREYYNRDAEALQKYRTKLEGLGIKQVPNTDGTIAHVYKEPPRFVQPPMLGPSELYKPSDSKSESWISSLPMLKLLPGVVPTDAFHPEDIIFGANCQGAVGGYASAYFFPKGRDFDAQTYRPWLGKWVGFPIHNNFSRNLDYIGPGVYKSELAQTPKEQQLLNALLVSRYNFASRGCVGETEQNSQDRTARASKSVLEMALFYPNIRKIHFILIPETHSSPVGYISEGKQYKRKSYRFTDHELRHLHRLALLYPKEVAEKVICWRDHKQVQLPAKLEPQLWEMWEPRLENIKKGPPVRAKL